MGLFSFDDDAWRVLEDPAELGLGDLFSEISPVDGRIQADPETTRLRARALPFYETAQLLELTDPNWPERLRVCYLIDRGNLFRLNGTSPPIHEVNAKAPIRIDTANVLFYLTFFCFFVRGEEGPFFVVDSLDNALLPNQIADYSDAKRQNRSVRDIFREPRYLGLTESGHHMVSSLIYYSNAVFFADFAIQPTGMIEMVDDMPLIADLPDRVDAPLT